MSDNSAKIRRKSIKIHFSQEPSEKDKYRFLSFLHGKSIVPTKVKMQIKKIIRKIVAAKNTFDDLEFKKWCTIIQTNPLRTLQNTRGNYQGTSHTKKLKEICSELNLRTNGTKRTLTERIINSALMKNNDRRCIVMTPERARKQGLTRWHDQKYYLTKVIMSKKPRNPSPEPDDIRRKKEIFGIPDLNTCIVTGEPCKGKGDHLFEINGYAKDTMKEYGKEMHGCDDWWNILPVVGRKNTSYKKYKFHDGKTTKDIGWQTLTDDEQASLTPEKKCLYDKIQEWKKYVEERGAKLCYAFTEGDIAFMAKKREQYNQFWSFSVK